MREVASAGAYNSQWDTPRKPAVSRHDDAYDQGYSTPSRPLPTSPFKSPSPSKPLLGSVPATPQAYNSRSQATPYDQGESYDMQPYTSSSRDMQYHDPYTTHHDPYSQAPAHDYYNNPPPPLHRDNSDYSHPDTSYHGNEQYHVRNSSNPSLSNPFHNRNRNSYYDEAGVYPEEHGHRASSRPEFDHIDPNSIEDDGDDQIRPVQRQSPRSRLPRLGAAAAGGSAAGVYSSVGQAPGSHLSVSHPQFGSAGEKSAWNEVNENEQQGRKKKKIILLSIMGILLVIGIALGAYFGITKMRSSSSGSSSSSSGSSGSRTSGLTASSSEIKALMNNRDLHKVFPVMDYTGLRMQYPDCLGDPPSQDNVTMDMAVLSQLTNAVRVYGTDCNQTDYIMTALDRLNMNDTMKIWLGVWIDNNATTNARQLAQMYDILHRYPQSHFNGVIVGNEALFRKDITETALITLLGQVRTNLTKQGITLSVSTSDLGSAWTSTLAAASDHVMGNIHPFFAGVTAAQASSWTWTFWQQNNVAIAPEPASATVPRNIISEVGWPSAGGNDCGSGVTCPSTTAGSVAGVPEMNRFMQDWVCQANANGTEYFWFEAFDEPWKVIYNTAQEQWEDKWGLMTIDRKLKSGITIPDCGGKTV